MFLHEYPPLVIFIKDNFKPGLESGFFMPKIYLAFIGGMRKDSLTFSWLSRAEKMI